MAVMSEKRTYSKLIKINDYYDRFEYLKIGGKVGLATFGYDRWINQKFYSSDLWKQIRNHIIERDLGRDMAVKGYDIYDKLIVHHINPITKNDILNRNPEIIDPENLICVSHLTHEAIHYGDRNLLPKMISIRTKYDTCPWKNTKLNGGV